MSRKYTKIKELEPQILAMRAAGKTRKEIAEVLELEKVQIANKKAALRSLFLYSIFYKKHFCSFACKKAARPLGFWNEREKNGGRRAACLQTRT